MPAPAVGPGPDQGERLEDGVVAGRRARLAGRRVHRVGAECVVVRDRDRRLAARLRARVHVEHGDAVPGRGVAARRPGRVLHRVGARPVIDAGGRGRHRTVGPGEHFRLVEPPGRGRAEHVQVRVGPAAAEDQVHGALTGVEDAAVHRRHRVRPPGVHGRAGGDRGPGGRVEPPNGERPLVVVVVPAEHQVHLVPVEQRQPRFADPQVRAVAVARGRAGALVQLRDDPVDRRVPAGRSQGRLQPPGLCAA